MQTQSFKLLLWTFLTFASLHQGRGAKCSADGPTVNQTQVGFGNPPKFMVEVHNNCAMCPVIDVHIKCGNFSQALVSPRLFKVLGHNDCVLNAGLPLPPLQNSPSTIPIRSIPCPHQSGTSSVNRTRTSYHCPPFL